MTDAAKPPKPETSIPKGALRPYFIRYVFVFIALYVLIVIIRALPPTWVSPSGVTALLPAVAATFLGEHFVKKETRLPSDEESEKLVDGFMFIAMIASIVLSLPAFLLGAYDEILDDSGLTFYLVVALVFMLLIALNYGFTRWFFRTTLVERAKMLGIIPDEEAA